MTTFSVSSGQTSSGLILSGGDALTVANGGSVVGLTVGTGASATVYAGGTIGGAIVDDGTIELQSGVVLPALTIDGGGFGILQVDAGASFGSGIADTGAIFLEPGFSGSGLYFSGSGGGAVFIQSGAVNKGAILDRYTEVVSGLASATQVLNGGFEEVDRGGISYAAMLTGAASEQDAAGGIASGTVANSGTTTTAYNGGTFISAVIRGGALQEVDTGGTTIGTVLSGGTQTVIGGVVSGTSVGSGATLDVSSGSSTSAVLYQGGTETVSAGGFALDTILSGGAVVIDGGEVELAASVASPDQGSIVFAGGGVLAIDGTVGPGATISDFVSSGVALDLTGIGAPLASDSYTVSGSRVTFSGSTGAVTLTIDPATLRAFLMVNDGTGGVSVTPASMPPPTIALAPASDSGVAGDDITNIKTPILTGSGTPGATVTVYDGSNPIGSGTVNNADSWSITASALTDGQHSIVAVETPSSGGPISSTALSLVIDTATPPSPSSLALAVGSDSGKVGDGITNVTRPTITGSGIAGDTVALIAGRNVTGTGVVQPDGTWSVTAGTVFSDGAVTFTATETSPAGNVSPASTGLQVMIDTAAPSAPGQPALAPGSDSGALGDDLTNNTRPTITGSGEPNDTVVLRDGQTPIGSATVLWNGVWSVTPTALLSDGLHSITAQLTDPAGNSSPVSLALSLRIDSTVPPPPAGLQLAAASDSGVLGDGVTNSITPVINGTGAAGDQVILFDGNASIGSAVVGAGGKWSVAPTTALGDGVHQITARQVNAAGTLSALSAALALTIDTVPPAAPTLTPGDGSATPAAPVLAGNAPGSAQVTVFDGGTSLGSAMVGSDGRWQFSLVHPLAAGSHVLTATATDLAGNRSSASAPLALTVAADKSYQVVMPADASGNAVTRYYNAAGLFAETDTRNSRGLLLTKVTNTSASLNIYQSDGSLIGSITQPSGSAGAQPTFTTSSGPLGATTSSGPAGSLISLTGGNQVLDSQGADTIVLGAGNDTIYASGPTVSIAGGSGKLTLIAGSTATTLTGGSGSALVFGGSGGGYVQGGRAGGNVLAAGSGNTTLVGGGAGDILVAGAGQTTIRMQAGGVAFGGTGQTTFYNASAGLVVGGSGTATMIAGDGPETMFAGSGDTTMTGGAGQAIMAGSDHGRTVMTGGAGDTQFVGYGGQVTATGGGGNDTFFTGGGPMQISEGPGYDQVVFGTGAATVTGGAGVDHYVFVDGAAGASEVISGFKVGIDQINLYGYDRTRVQTSASTRGLAIALQDGTRITLVGVTRLDANSIA